MNESGEAEEVGGVGEGIEDEVGFEETEVVGVEREEFGGEKRIVGVVVGFEEESVELASE